MKNNLCSEPEIGALLHAYELDALSEEEIERFEIHLLKCPHCFAEVQRFSDQAELLRSHPIVKQEVAKITPVTTVKEKLSGRLIEYLWPQKPLIFKPAVLVLIILLLIYPAYQGFYPDSESDIRTVATINLFPSRDNGNNILITPGRDVVLSFIYREAIPGKRYTLELKYAEDILLRNETFTDFNKYNTGTLIIPSTLIKPGNYRLEIIDPENLLPAGTQIYLFKIRY